jgi:hypothetical protein
MVEQLHPAEHLSLEEKRQWYRDHYPLYTDEEMAMFTSAKDGKPVNPIHFKYALLKISERNKCLVKPISEGILPRRGDPHFD